MKNGLLILSFIFVANTVFGQQAKVAQPQPPRIEDARPVGNDHECVHRDKYSIAQRLTFYPFSKAHQIKIVSFNDSSFFGSIPLVNHTVDYSKLTEIKGLTKKGVNELTDVLYNIGERAPNRIADTERMC